VAVSVLWAFVALPTVVLGPIAGAAADRYDRRLLMVGADIISAAVLGLCLLVVASGFTLAGVYASVLAVNVLATFHRPASEALLPSLAGDENIGRANSALRMATRLAMIGGPALASGLTTVGGFGLVLAVDAVTFLGSSALIAGIVSARVVRDGSHVDSPLRSALAGLTYARNHRAVRTVIGAVGLTMLVASIVNAGTLALVSDALHLPESRYGILLAAEGGGALALALLFTYLGPRIPLLPTGAAALLTTGGATVALGLSPGMAMAIAAQVVMGMGVVGLQVAFASYLQRETPDEFRGRVMSLVLMVSSVGALLGLAATGPSVYLLGVRAALAFAGGLICLSALPVLLLLRQPAALSPETVAPEVA
jgi:MFS family permease